LRNEVLKHLNELKLDRLQLAQVARMIDEPVSDTSRVKTAISEYPLISLDYYKTNIYVLNAEIVDISEVTTKDDEVFEFYHRVDKNKNHWILCDILNKGEFLFENTNLLELLLNKMESKGFCSIQAIEKYKLKNAVWFYIKHEQSPLTTTFATSMTLIAIDKKQKLALENVNNAFDFLQQSVEYKKLLEE